MTKTPSKNTGSTITEINKDGEEVQRTLPFDVKRTSQITLPGLSFKTREYAYVRFISSMHKSDRVDEGDDKRRAATVARVVDLEDGMEYRLICPALLVSGLEDDGIDYVGKCYEIYVSIHKRPGKDYKDVSVHEIECPSAADSE